MLIKVCESRGVKWKKLIGFDIIKHMNKRNKGTDSDFNAALAYFVAPEGFVNDEEKEKARLEAEKYKNELNHSSKIRGTENNTGCFLFGLLGRGRRERR